jgi:hypothetical protein
MQGKGVLTTLNHIRKEINQEGEKRIPGDPIDGLLPEGVALRRGLATYSAKPST